MRTRLSFFACKSSLLCWHFLHLLATIWNLKKSNCQFLLKFQRVNVVYMPWLKLCIFIQVILHIRGNNKQQQSPYSVLPRQQTIAVTSVWDNIFLGLWKTVFGKEYELCCQKLEHCLLMRSTGKHFLFKAMCEQLLLWAPVDNLTLHYSGRQLRMNFISTVAQWDKFFVFLVFIRFSLFESCFEFGEVC